MQTDAADRQPQFLAKEQMIQVLIAAVLGLASLNATALKAIEDGGAWNKATSGQRDAVVRKIMQQSKADYPDAKLRECIDAFYAPPAPAVHLEQEIVSAAIRCQAKLKPRK